MGFGDSIGFRKALLIGVFVIMAIISGRSNKALADDGAKPAGMTDTRISRGSETKIYINPLNEVFCQLGDYPAVNWIKKVQKISESVEAVTFQFVSEYGFCEHNKLQEYPIDAEEAAVGFFSEADLWGFRKVVTNLKIMPVPNSQNEVLVEMTFLKKRIFAGGRTGRLFVMEFDPRGPNILRFAWSIWLEKVPAAEVADETTLSFSIKGSPP